MSKAPVYNITQNAGDSHQSTPFWLAAFVRFKNRNSFDAEDFFSTTAALSNPVEEASLLVVDDDLISWNTSTSIDSHISGFSGTLLHSDTDYRQALAGGDWMVFWAFNNKADYLRIKTALVKQNFGAFGLNGFKDGLKFLGRVTTPHQQKSRLPDGRMTTTYSLSANGFSELESQMYWNPYLAKDNPNSLKYVADFGLEIGDFLAANGNINTQSAIPALMLLCLGLGIGDASKHVITAEAAQAANDPNLKAFSESQENTISPNEVYQVPTTIMKILGQNGATVKKGTPTYADLLRTYIGIHDYSSSPSDRPPFGLPGYNNHKNNVYYCNDPLTDVFSMANINWNGMTVWSIMCSFLNEPINEIYTCLKADPSGHVLPTLMIRQCPLVTNNFQKTHSQATTPYLSVPRWVIDDSMIYSTDTGRTDAQRVNYVYVTGHDRVITDQAKANAISIQTAPPIVDIADVCRSGLRMLSIQCSASFELLADSPAAKLYSEMLAERYMGGHLKYDGTYVLNGVQEPICEGDNATIEGIVYRIERVMHSGGYVDVSKGTKDFKTTLQLTYGVSVDSDNDPDGLFVFPGANPDVEVVDKTISTNKA